MAAGASLAGQLRRRTARNAQEVRRGYQFAKVLKSIEKALSETVDLALAFGFDSPKR